MPITRVTQGMGAPAASRAHGIFAAAAGVIVWLSWLVWPLPPTTGLDPSWQLVLGYAHVRGWRFGSDFVFTHGPWSWLNVVHCHPATFWPHTAWQLLFKGVVAAAFVSIARKLPVWRAILLAATAALLLPVFEDVAPVLLIVWIAVYAGRAKRLPLPALLAAGTLFGFMALQKFTYGVLIAVACGGVTTLFALKRQPRKAAIFAATTIGSLCLFWLLAGQEMTALPAFFHRSWQLASLYSETMFIYEAPAVFWWGVITSGAAGIAIILAVRVAAVPRAIGVTIGALAFAFAFLIWKQGFVRADGHVQGFFLCALAVGLVLRPVASGLALAVAAATGFAVSSPELFVRSPEFFSFRIRTSIASLTSPFDLQSRLEAQTAAAAQAAELPRIREAVGQEAVDVFGDDHAVALLNGLPYRPRPVFQTHQAFSAPLAELNARFYSGDKAPEYVLARLSTIDGRFVAADDARVLAILLQNYGAALEENGWHLLRRRREPQRAPFTPVGSRKTRFGLAIKVPQHPDGLLRVEIDVRPTALGRLRTFLYKPPLVTLVVDDGISPRRYRFVVPAARGGFLIGPLVHDTEDLRQWLNGAAATAAQTLTLEIEPASRKYYKEKFALRFAAAPPRRSTE